ncbi:hypothetical protein EYB25_006966 [Talaromyces marneffei]|uniref:4-hydroxyphenylpyruvate dioxygenase n=1 Tax=Talaromyces marneffei PM1 TaxID=1077442 RepID=A0A093UQU3_TALMA|nr:uncharacterized protein EYB26_008107 [Talaromyces marneffei]KAE8550738.1 hypothetical protein EYB25_006966 [Talaromyces marneffei]QGA20405.1 hypothetical protein EYB26_008107 [Talaromyces marneffei]
MESPTPASHNSHSHSMQFESPVGVLDSWIGVTDPKKRKKLQNRLNQRAHRRRQRALRTQQQQKDADIDVKQEPDTDSNQPPTNSTNPPRSLDHLDFCTPTNTKHLEKLEALIRMEFAMGSPTADLLLGLTQLNIIRVLHANRDILGYTASDMHDDALSAFNLNVNASMDINLNLVCQSSIIKTRSDLPLALQPTTTQYKVPHHPWLDLIPIPKMRDHLIRAGDSIDDVKLCYDMCGYRVPETGILIWKEPWDPSGWEVTERFLQLWGWAVRDCWELFDSTDRWRRKRGERPLFNLPRKLSQ